MLYGGKDTGVAVRWGMWETRWSKADSIAFFTFDEGKSLGLA